MQNFFRPSTILPVVLVLLLLGFMFLGLVLLQSAGINGELLAGIGFGGSLVIPFLGLGLHTVLLVRERNGALHAFEPQHGQRPAIENEEELLEQQLRLPLITLPVLGLTKDDLSRRALLNSYRTLKLEERSDLVNEYFWLEEKLEKAICPITYDELDLDFAEDKWVILIKEKTADRQAKGEVVAYNKEALKQWLDSKETNPLTNEAVFSTTRSPLFRMETLGRMKEKEGYFYYSASLLALLVKIEQEALKQKTEKTNLLQGFFKKQDQFNGEKYSTNEDLEQGYSKTL